MRNGREGTIGICKPAVLATTGKKKSIEQKREFSTNGKPSN